MLTVVPFTCSGAIEIQCVFQAVKSEEEFLLYATSKIAHLCAYNVVLWQTFTEICTYNVRVIKVLAKEHHQNRVSYGALFMEIR